MIGSIINTIIFLVCSWWIGKVMDLIQISSPHTFSQGQKASDDSTWADTAMFLSIGTE